MQAQVRAARLSVVHATTCLPMLDRVMDLSLPIYRRRIPFEHAALGLVEPDESLRLQWVRSEGVSTRLLQDAVLPLSVTSLVPVLEAGRPVVRNDLRAWAARHPAAASIRVLLADGMRADIVAPVTTETEAIGVLVLGSTREGAFDEVHLEAAEDWARSIGALFERCQSCREALAAANPDSPACAASVPGAQVVPPPRPEVHGALVDTTRMIREELRMLAEVSERINSGLHLHEVLELIYDSFRRILPVDRMTYARIDPDGHSMHIVWTRSVGHPSSLDPGTPIALGATGLDEVLEAGHVRILSDLRAFLEAHPDSRTTQDLVASGMLSSMTCPLQVDGKPVGFLFLGSHLPGAYDDDHVRIFTIVARQVAMSLQRSWLYAELLDEREKSEELLRNILPVEVAERLKQGPSHLARRYEAVTVLFADLVGFSELATLIEAEELVSRLDLLFSAFDDICERHGVETIKTIGDGYMAAAGLPDPCPDHAARCAEAALDMLEAATRLHGPAGQPLQLRIGLHSGPVVAGVIGHHKLHYDLWGDTVNIASRMQSTGVEGRVQVTGVTADILRYRFVLTRRGPVQLKGRGTVETCFLDGRAAR